MDKFYEQEMPELTDRHCETEEDNVPEQRPLKRRRRDLKRAPEEKAAAKKQAIWADIEK